VTPLDEACADLTAWLPVAAALITQPDTQPPIGRTKPGSKPPWNAEAAGVIHETIGVLADIHLEMAHAVHGRYVWDPAYRHAARTLTAITRLAEACDRDTVHHATHLINSRVTAIMQLPAVDLEQPWRTLPGPCPRSDCGRPMLRYRKGDHMQPAQLACLGCMRGARIMPGTVSDGCVQWEDGTIT